MVVKFPFDIGLCFTLYVFLDCLPCVPMVLQHYTRHYTTSIRLVWRPWVTNVQPQVQERNQHPHSFYWCCPMSIPPLSLYLSSKQTTLWIEPRWVLRVSLSWRLVSQKWQKRGSDLCGGLIVQWTRLRNHSDTWPRVVMSHDSPPWRKVEELQAVNQAKRGHVCVFYKRSL